MLRWAYPLMFPNRFVVKSRKQSTLEVQGYSAMQQRARRAGLLRAGFLQDLPERYQPKISVASADQRTIRNGAAPRAAPGRRDRGKPQIPDSRQNSASDRRSAGPIIPPAIGRRHRPASSG